MYSVFAFYFVPHVSGDPCGVDRTGIADLSCDCSDIFLIGIIGEGDISPEIALGFALASPDPCRYHCYHCYHCYHYYY